jgi:hypothetical protein
VKAGSSPARQDVGLAKYATVTLKRNLTTSRTIHDRHARSLTGQVAAHRDAVTLVADGEGWPTR